MRAIGEPRQSEKRASVRTRKRIQCSQVLISGRRFAMLIGQQIGPFEIDKELGSGAMGTVYKARFQRSENKIEWVALKVVALGLVGNESAMARFEREANILKQLRHPHIVRLIAHGKIKKNPYIAMEFIDGEALDRVLARRGKLSWEEVLTYGKQLCEALQYAHDKGIMHRDLKPSNLMITQEGTLKLTDFGIAKDTDVTALTGANSTIGTAAYMSPEQCKGERTLTNKSDLYSLGICFFELLTGRKAFIAGTTVEMFLKHVNEKAPRIGKLVNDLPVKFESLILQLLEKDKDERPIDAKWVCRMLNEIEQDAFDRKSAGLSVAENRTAKPTNQSGDAMSAEDKDAARALRNKNKTKKRKKVVPFFQRTWVKAAGFVAILLSLVALTVYLVMPASQAKMFAAIEKAQTPEDKLAAATKYLEHYGDRPGEMTDKAAAVYREEMVREREKVLATRYKRGSSNPPESYDPEAYKAAWQALEAEETGQWDDVETYWTKVKNRFPEEAKLPFTLEKDTLAKALWGWLGEKRLADLKAAREKYNSLFAKISENRRGDVPTKFDSNNLESLALQALRLKEFNDGDRAIAVCDSLRKKVESDPDKLVWFLIAARINAEARKNKPANPVDNRLGRIKALVEEAKTLAATPKGDPNYGRNRRDARVKCREVIELYEDDDHKEVKDVVAKARDIMKTVE